MDVLSIEIKTPRVSAHGALQKTINAYMGIFSPQVK
jgi:hypothetical protein